MADCALECVGFWAAEEPLEVTAGSAHEALIQAGCGCSGDAEALKVLRGSTRFSAKRGVERRGAASDQAPWCAVPKRLATMKCALQVSSRRKTRSHG